METAIALILAIPVIWLIGAFWSNLIKRAIRKLNRPRHSNGVIIES